MNPRKRIFIDTSAWIVYMISSEQYHDEVAAYFDTELDNHSIILTSDYVLDECFTKLISSYQFHIALQLRKTVKEAQKAHHLVVLWTDETLFEKSWETFVKYADHGLSFTDATIAVLMRDLKLDEVLTLDQGFAKVGLSVRPKLQKGT